MAAEQDSSQEDPALATPGPSKLDTPGSRAARHLTGLSLETVADVEASRATIQSQVPKVTDPDFHSVIQNQLPGMLALCNERHPDQFASFLLEANRIVQESQINEFGTIPDIAVLQQKIDTLNKKLSDIQSDKDNGAPSGKGDADKMDVDSETLEQREKSATATAKEMINKYRKDLIFDEADLSKAIDSFTQATLDKDDEAKLETIAILLRSGSDKLRRETKRQSGLKVDNTIASGSTGEELMLKHSTLAIDCNDHTKDWMREWVLRLMEKLETEKWQEGGLSTTVRDFGPSLRYGLANMILQIFSAHGIMHMQQWLKEVKPGPKNNTGKIGAAISAVSDFKDCYHLQQTAFGLLRADYLSTITPESQSQRGAYSVMNGVVGAIQFFMNLQTTYQLWIKRDRLTEAHIFKTKPEFQRTDERTEEQVISFFQTKFALSQNAWRTEIYRAQMCYSIHQAFPAAVYLIGHKAWQLLTHRRSGDGPKVVALMGIIHKHFKKEMDAINANSRHIAYHFNNAFLEADMDGVSVDLKNFEAKISGTENYVLAAIDAQVAAQFGPVQPDTE